eukprot:EG_transcript_30639
MEEAEQKVSHGSASTSPPGTIATPPPATEPTLPCADRPTAAAEERSDHRPPPDFAARTAHAFRCLAAGALLPASNAFKAALRLRPNDIQALYNVASAEELLGHTDAAQQYLALALQCVPEPDSEADAEATGKMRVLAAKRRRKQRPPTAPPAAADAAPSCQALHRPSEAEWRRRFRCPKWLRGPRPPATLPP